MQRTGQAAEVRFEWGPTGIAADASTYVVVVDVLRFTTAVEVAVSRGAIVHPYRWRDESARTYADSLGARLAGGDDPDAISLSPARLARLDAGDRIVLPSPNGSTCAAIAAERGATVVAACLRNASAVAAWLAARADQVLVVACGERWRADDSLRPALEDLLGAAAVISALGGRRSPDAQAAAVLWQAVHADADALIRGCPSGLEQVERGWAADLDLAVQVDVSTTVPVLVDGAFIDGSATR